MTEEQYPVCTSAACRSRAPLLMAFGIGIGGIAGVMLESLLGLTASVALGALLAAACCLRRSLAAGHPLPFRRGELKAAAAAFFVGGVLFTAAMDIIDPAITVESLTVGGLMLCGGSAAAGLLLSVVWLWRRIAAGGAKLAAGAQVRDRGVGRLDTGVGR